MAGVGLLLSLLERLHPGRKNLSLPEPAGGWSSGSGNRLVIKVVQKIEFGRRQDPSVAYRILLRSNVDLKPIT
jgi:hypothetical protein